MSVLKGYIEKSVINDRTEQLKARILSARKHAYAEIMRNIAEYSIATISACRTYRREAYKRYRDENGLSLKDPANVWEAEWADEYMIPKQENLRRQKELQLQLYKAGLEGIMPIYGCYKEDGMDEASLEESFICFHKDYLYLMETIMELGTLFEQDAVCVLRPNGSRGLLIKTSPKDINAEPKVRLYQPFMYFRGFDANETDRPEEAMQVCFSRINNANFWWREDKSLLKSYRIITGLQSAILGLHPTEYKTMAHRVYAKGKDYTAPKEVITTAKGVFSAWCDLSKPHPLRTPLHENILKSMIRDEK